MNQQKKDVNQQNYNRKITWAEFGKFIGVTVTILTVVIGGMQFYFSSQNNISEKLLILEEKVNTIKTNDLEHIDADIKEIKKCQSDQEDIINKIDKTTVKILERIKQYE